MSWSRRRADLTGEGGVFMISGADLVSTCGSPCLSDMMREWQDKGSVFAVDGSQDRRFEVGMRTMYKSRGDTMRVEFAKLTKS